MWNFCPSDFSFGVTDERRGILVSASSKFASIGCTSLARAAIEGAEVMEPKVSENGHRVIPVEAAMCILAKRNRFRINKDERGSRIVSPSFGTYEPAAVPLGLALQHMPDIAGSFRDFRSIFVMVPSCSNLTWESALVQESMRSVLFGFDKGEFHLICEWNKLDYFGEKNET